jgi:hypothetical protein
MQTRHESILRSINSNKRYNILTAPTHERYQSNLSNLNSTFYLFQHKAFKPWNNAFAKLPSNHILLDGSNDQIKHDMQFDIALSQNKFGQFQVLKQLSQDVNIPLVSIEHTLPVPQWGKLQMESVKNMRGDINIFISEYSVNKWGFSLEDPTVRIIHHAVDTNLFKPSEENNHSDGKILSVVNDWINRDWCCNFSAYRRICLDNKLPVNPVGDTKGFSDPSKDINDLVSKYQNASVFINTSTISPIPTALLEAMSCGCPVVTTSNCMLPEVVQDGVNGFITNDEGYMKDRLVWCLENPKEAKEMGLRARQTIIDKFSLDKHINSWQSIFNEVAGKGHNL